VSAHARGLGPDVLLAARGLAALAVVFWHTVGYHGTLPNAINVPGRVSVWLFFGISGYVIACGFLDWRYTFQPRSLARYARNRALRIMPLFWTVSAVGLGWAWAASGESPIGASNWASQLLALQWNQSYVLNGVFWTLGIEMQFYVVAPALAWLLLRRPSRWGTVVFMLLMAMAMAWPGVHSEVLGGSVDLRNLLHNLDMFMAGMAGAALAPRFVSARRLRWHLLAGALGSLVACNVLYHLGFGPFIEWKGRIAMVVCILLLVGAHVSFESGSPIKSRWWRVLAWLGTISYGLYAWHGLLVMHSSFLESHFLATAAISIVFAGVSYALVERPCLRAKRYEMPAAQRGA
jgi:peptidoglycan/LPS O-acetylase OafA/YrhL